MLLLLTLSTLVGCSHSSSNPKLQDNDSGWDADIDSGTMDDDSSDSGDSGQMETTIDGRHLFISGCFIQDTPPGVLYDCSIAGIFIFSEPIDGITNSDLEWTSEFTSEETQSGELLARYASLVDGDTNISLYRPLWGRFTIRSTGERHDVANNAMPPDGFRYEDFSAGGTTACVAAFDGETATLHCAQFTTQTCDENWEAVLPGFTCEELNNQEWSNLADDHPYFHGESSE